MENNLLKNRFSRTVRKVWGIFFLATALLILSLAACVPFIYEAQTLGYQFGISRTLLQTGHVMGTSAAAFIFLQLVLIARIKFLDRIFSVNRMLSQHRINAVIILILVSSHFILILNILGAETLALDVRQWPEFTGLLVLMMLTFIVAAGLLRKYIGLSFRFWMFSHKVFTPVAVILMCIHVYCVSDTFHYGNAHFLIICFFVSCFLVYIVNRLIKLSAFKYAYRVESVRLAGNNIYTLELLPEKNRRIVNIPGQFAFVKFKSANISGEEHPFTVSSSPTRSPDLQFTIRSSGDWTEKIRFLNKGDKAFISESFGIFGHLDMNSSGEMIMIAGGIGITPMLSILRYLLDVKSSRKIKLLWSVRTHKEIVYPDEFSNMEENLPGLTVNYVFTREEGRKRNAGRFDRDNLKTLTSGCSRDSIILLCGPPGMMFQVKKILISLGFPQKSIITERFSF